MACLLQEKKHKLGLFEKTVLSRIFGPKREEVRGIGENFVMYSSPNIIQVDRIRMGQMWPWKREEIRTEFYSENLSGRDHLEDLSTDEMIILKWINRF
jgi:hypothetical protein